MKAAVVTAYGPPEVIQIQQTPKPNIHANDILIKVHAVAVTSADTRIRAARFPKGFGVFARLVFGVTKPRKPVLGSTYSGVVEQVGDSVHGFAVGDEVCGMTGISMGTYAEYIRVRGTKSTALKPKTISHEQAAGLLFGGTAALYFVRNKLAVGKGDSVLVNGASGAVGTNAVQLAKHFGAKVTGVTSANNTNLVKQLGASQCIDYTKHDLSSIEERFDVVLDTIGTISPALAAQMLKPNGRAGLMVATLGETFKARGNIKTGTATEKAEDIMFLLGLVEQGALDVVIDKTYPFAEIVQAHKHADTGQKVGNIVVKL
jgi:NADPH:quinone reductase-like Zn-dependent oxidoreductase